MVNLRPFCVGLMILAALAGASWSQEKGGPAKGLEGYWQATAKVGGGTVDLRLVLKFDKDRRGNLTGTLNLPDTGTAAIPFSDIRLSGQQVFLEIKEKKAVIELTFNKDQTALTGTLKQGGADIPVIFQRLAEAPAAKKRPQHPQRPFPYAEEELKYENKKAGVTLAGTLTLPPGKGPFPAVLLITGSGTQDRDSTIMEHKPFLVLADYLTRRGIAVLRVDDRGAGKSTGNPATATTLDFAEDVFVGVEVLKARKDIDPRQIGLLGHSEGAIIGPMVASQGADIAFLVMLAGSGLPGEEVLLQQGPAILKAMGAGAKQQELSLLSQKANYAIVKKEKDNAAALKLLRAPLLAAIEKLDGDAKKAALQQLAAADAEYQKLVSPWFRFFLTYDPRPALTKVQCPVLVLNGDRDLQVLAQENLAEIGKALKAGGNKDYTIKQLPNLNHLFQTCQKGVPQEYGAIEETFAPAALEIIGDWIVQRTLRRAR